MQTDPYPHVILDDWFDRELLKRIAAEIPDKPGGEGWSRYDNDKERKYGGNPSTWGPAARSYFASLLSRITDIETMFGIPRLRMEVVGGGYHVIPPGGRLAMHTDFNRSPTTGWFRRINCLTFLNENWDDPGGYLMLGEDCEIVIAPEMGRTVMFATSDRSWHGHPIPTEHRTRKSVAAYFFTHEPPDEYDHEHSTVWMEG